MFLRDYNVKPDELDKMSCNDVYSIVFVRKAEQINRRFEEAYKDKPKVGFNQNLIDQLGARK